MHSGPHAIRFAALFIAMTGSFSLAAYGQSRPPSNGTTSMPGPVLPRKLVVPKSVVNRFFPKLPGKLVRAKLNRSRQSQNHRSVIYANSDSSKKVTITLEQYASPTDASSAYQEAVQKSKIVPGVKPVSASDLGQNAFIGTVTQGDETHIGLGALQGTQSSEQRWWAMTPRLTM